MNNSDIVIAFVNAWNRMDWDQVFELMTDDVVYHNIPMQRIEGKPAAREAILAMQPEAVDWQILSIAENGNKVLTERLDDFDMPGGRRLSMPVMGTFEITDGRISAWRDYFDLGTFTRQMS